MIRIRRGDLCDSTAEVVVRETVADGASRTVIGRRVEVALGEKVLGRLESIGGMEVGTAVLTPGGDLGVSFALHLCMSSVEEPITVRGVERSLRNGLSRISDFGIGSVALPPLGMGAGSLEAEAAAELLIRLLREHLASGSPPLAFEVVVESEYEEDVFRQALGRNDLLDDAADES